MELVHILLTATNAICPIVILILIGYVLRRIGFLNDNFIQIGSKFGFNVCIPCMQFINVYSIDGFSSIRWDVVLYCAAVVLLIFVLGLISAVFTTKVPERRGVILQCVFRSNVAVIGLSLASALGGTEAVAITSIVSALTLPLKNILAVVALSIFVGDSGNRRKNFRKMLISIAKNPLIIGIVLGMICLCIRAFQIKQFGRVIFSLNGQLKFLYTSINNLRLMTTSLTLIVLGGQFEFSAAQGRMREIVVGTLWRIVFAPFIGIGIAVLMSIHTDILKFGINEYPALIAVFGTPAAVSGAIMAGQMGNDEKLATQLIVWTSVGSIATMFLTVCVLMAAGLLAT